MTYLGPRPIAALKGQGKSRIMEMKRGEKYVKDPRADHGDRNHGDRMYHLGRMLNERVRDTHLWRLLTTNYILRPI